MNEIVEAFQLVLETKPLLVIILSLFIFGSFALYFYFINDGNHHDNSKCRKENHNQHP